MYKRNTAIPPFSSLMAPLSKFRLDKAGRARAQYTLARKFADKDCTPTSPIHDTLDMVRQESSRLCHHALEQGLISDAMIAAEKDPLIRRRISNYANGITGWLNFADRLNYSK